MSEEKQFMTTQEAAQFLGVSDRRVLALIKSGKLQAQKFGWMWMIKADDLAAFEATRQRKAGRPRKSGN